MTRLAVGRGWRQATPEQQKALVEQFRTLLIRSYSTAYTAYQEHRHRRKTGPDATGRQDVQVRSEIKLPDGGQPISVDYSMYKARIGLEESTT